MVKSISGTHPHFYNNKSKYCKIMFEFPKKVSLSGYTFVIPSLAVGNVPQLAVDLIIESLKMTKIGFAFHSAIVPVIGPPAFAHASETEVTTSFEAFVCEEKKLVALQLRAPVAAKLLQSFLDELVSFLQESQPSQVIILGSCFSHERHDAALKRKLEYVGNDSFCTAFEEHLTGFVQHPENKLPWQGFATKLYEAVKSKLHNVPIGVLFAYVSEGDNVQDAKDLALFLDNCLAIFTIKDPVTLPIPMSWKLLFGNAGPVELF